MTNNSPFDEHIKEKFGNYTPDVPPHIWENIIAEKEKRRPGAFWINFINKNLALLLLCCIVTGTGIIIYNKLSSPADTKTSATNELLATTNKTENNSQPESTPEKITATYNISTSNDQPTTTNGSTGTGNTISATEKNNVAGKASINIHSAANSSNNNDPAIVSADIKTNTTTSYKKPTRSKGSASLRFTSPEVVSDNAEETSESDLLLNRFLLNLDMLRSERNLNTTVKQVNNPHLDIPCPEAEKNAAGNKRYFEVYAGPDYAFRSITDTGNSAYLQKRKESTSFSSAFSAGLRYTRVFSNGMSFRTGINYSQINEKFKYAEGNIIQVVYIINGNGDTTGSYTSTGTRYKTTHNKFRTFDIPLLIGYELGNGRIHANFNAGAIINAYSWQKGDVLDTAYQPVSITTGKSSSPYQFKTNVGIGFIGAVSVYYKLTDRWHIFAEPYFRYNFSPASKADLTLKQKYNTAGLRFGVRIDF